MQELKAEDFTRANGGLQDWIATAITVFATTPRMDKETFLDDLYETARKIEETCFAVAYSSILQEQQGGGIQDRSLVREAMAVLILAIQTPEGKGTLEAIAAMKPPVK